MSEPRVFWETTPLRTISKYFDDGRIELWLSDEDNNELYLIRHYQSPTGKSPIFDMKYYADEITPTTIQEPKEGRP